MINYINLKKKCTHALVFSDIFFRPSSIHSVQNHIFLTQKSKLWRARIFFWPNNTLLEHFGSKHLLIIMVYILKKSRNSISKFLLSSKQSNLFLLDMTGTTYSLLIHLLPARIPQI